MTPTQITTGPSIDLPGPAAAAFIVALAILAAGAPLNVFRPNIRPARKDRHVNPAPLAATEEEQRSPDWCWTHNCHRSQCPGGH